MATTLSDIRFLIERQVKYAIEDADVLNWSNEVNADIGTNINIPTDPVEITLTTTDLEYTLPDDLKLINRLRLQSDINQMIDTDLLIDYRIYSGKIILPRILWIAPDTLVVDYYKHLTYFETIFDEIDLPDRLRTVYTFYGFSKYYQQPDVIARIGENQARANQQNYAQMYEGMKINVISYYSLSDEPVIIDRMW
jgi:hypothetical protein